MEDLGEKTKRTEYLDLITIALELAVEDAGLWAQGGLAKVQEAYRNRWGGPYTKEEYIQRARELKAKREGGP